MRNALMVLTMLAGAGSPLLDAAELRPFTASYSVTWRGMSAGRSQLHLERLPDGKWRYESSNQARGVFRIALPGELSQRSVFEIHEGAVRPLNFTADDGGEGASRDAELTFDWNAARVTGTAGGKRVDLPLEPGLQDGMSIQASLLHALLNGRTPERFLMLDGDRVKEYIYTREGEQRLDTAVGTHHTVVFRSARPGTRRGTLFWCAPVLGYLPVRVERRNGDKVEWSMTLLDARVDTAP